MYSAHHHALNESMLNSPNKLSSSEYSDLELICNRNADEPLTAYRPDQSLPAGLIVKPRTSQCNSQQSTLASKGAKPDRFEDLSENEVCCQARSGQADDHEKENNILDETDLNDLNQHAINSSITSSTLSTGWKSIDYYDASISSVGSLLSKTLGQQNDSSQLSAASGNQSCLVKPAACRRSTLQPGSVGQPSPIMARNKSGEMLPHPSAFSSSSSSLSSDTTTRRPSLDKQASSSDMSARYLNQMEPLKTFHEKIRNNIRKLPSPVSFNHSKFYHISPQYDYSLSNNTEIKTSPEDADEMTALDQQSVNDKLSAADDCGQAASSSKNTTKLTSSSYLRRSVSAPFPPKCIFKGSARNREDPARQAGPDGADNCLKKRHASFNTAEQDFGVPFEAQDDTDHLEPSSFHFNNELYEESQDNCYFDDDYDLQSKNLVHQVKGSQSFVADAELGAEAAKCQEITDRKFPSRQQIQMAQNALDETDNLMLNHTDELQADEPFSAQVLADANKKVTTSVHSTNSQTSGGQQDLAKMGNVSFSSSFTTVNNSHSNANPNNFYGGSNDLVDLRQSASSSLSSISLRNIPLVMPSNSSISVQMSSSSFSSPSSSTQTYLPPICPGKSGSVNKLVDSGIMTSSTTTSCVPQQTSNTFSTYNKSKSAKSLIGFSLKSTNVVAKTTATTASSTPASSRIGVAGTNAAPIHTSQSSLAASSMSASSNQFFYKDSNNSNKILDGLNKLRLTKSFYDVVLKVEAEEFACHKCVLCSLSSYFHVMFSSELAESKKETIQMNDLDAATMRSIIDYAYTSQLTIHENNVQALLSAANLLDIKPIKSACCRYLEWQMDASNCIGIHCFSDTFDCQELKQISYKYILSNFAKVAVFDELLSLSQAKLIDLISDDSLDVPNEDAVYNACIKWLHHAIEERSPTFHQVLEHIRLPQLSAYFLYDRVQNEQTLKQCDSSRALIQEALMYNLLKDRRNQTQNERTRSRRSYQHVEALVVIGGENEQVVMRSTDCYLPSIDRWLPLSSSPMAISKHGTVSSEESIVYMAGGEWPDGNPTDSFWQYNYILDEWKELCCLQTARSELGLTLVDGCVYAVGGWDGQRPISTVERYDPSLNTWKYCAPMKIPIASPAVCSLNGLLYVTCSSAAQVQDRRHHDEQADFVQVYNPITDTWREIAPMITPRSGCVSCGVNNKLYVIGGSNSAGQNTNTVECYDPFQDKWETCPSMLECRYKPGLAVLNNGIYICGGERDDDDAYLDSIEVFDLDKKQWSYVSSMNSGRSWLACATIRIQNPLKTSPASLEAGKGSDENKIRFSLADSMI